jgi:2-hydroxychromene-2-carboxylate isomerase
MPASRTIGYCFTLQSPWAYIGHAIFLDMARRHGARIDYKPMSLGEVFPASGGLPLAKRHPSRQAYRMIELKRWRARRGLDFNLQPAFWPFEVARADRVVIALVSLGLDPETFVTQAFSAIWQREQNLADDAVIAEILRACGHDAAKVMTEAGAARSGELYRANGNEALAAGVFGSPTYLLDGEPFWGQDRLDFLDEALASGRPPIRP